jgi:hypothetical protein
MEQQFSFGKLPQTVPPFEDPQVPSVVTGAVAADPGAAVAVTGAITGSPVVVVGPSAEEVPSVQPDWHPFSTRQ